MCVCVCARVGGKAVVSKGKIIRLGQRPGERLNEIKLAQISMKTFLRRLMADKPNRLEFVPTLTRLINLLRGKLPLSDSMASLYYALYY